MDGAEEIVINISNCQDWGGTNMAKFIQEPTRIEAAGNKPKLIDEFFGNVNSGTAGISIARMQSPSGWVEPGQTPEFDEYTVVLRGMLKVETKDGLFEVNAGQGILTLQGEWIRYSTPDPDGAEYIAVCLPAFSPDTVHRDE
jgi:mannose-6-phosphate isomerase-like protein (cupin superfamily)